MASVRARMFSILGWVSLAYLIEQKAFTLKNVDGRSMQPLFNPDSSIYRDIVLFHRFPLPPLERGEVVFLKSPTDPNVLLVKRVIALEGDIVQPLPKYPEPMVRIPPQHVWVEGDEPRGRDSNSFGPVSMGLIQGRAVGIVWPFSRFGSLPVGADTGDPWSIPSRLAARERSRAARVIRSDTEQ